MISAAESYVDPITHARDSIHTVVGRSRMMRKQANHTSSRFNERLTPRPARLEFASPLGRGCEEVTRGEGRRRYSDDGAGAEPAVPYRERPYGGLGRHRASAAYASRERVYECHELTRCRRVVH